MILFLLENIQLQDLCIFISKNAHAKECSCFKRVYKFIYVWKMIGKRWNLTELGLFFNDEIRTAARTKVMNSEKLTAEI